MTGLEGREDVLEECTEGSETPAKLKDLEIQQEGMEPCVRRAGSQTKVSGNLTEDSGKLNRRAGIWKVIEPIPLSGEKRQTFFALLIRLKSFFFFFYFLPALFMLFIFSLAFHPM